MKLFPVQPCNAVHLLLKVCWAPPRHIPGRDLGGRHGGRARRLFEIFPFSDGFLIVKLLKAILSSPSLMTHSQNGLERRPQIAS